MNPCPKCGVDDRYDPLPGKNIGKCRPCARARSAAAFRANPEAQRARSKRYAERNRDAIRERNRRYMERKRIERGPVPARIECIPAPPDLVSVAAIREAGGVLPPQYDGVAAINFWTADRILTRQGVFVELLEAV